MSFSSMDGRSKDRMVVYNKLCRTVKEEKPPGKILSLKIGSLKQYKRGEMINQKNKKNYHQFND